MVLAVVPEARRRAGANGPGFGRKDTSIARHPYAGKYIFKPPAGTTRQ